MKPAPPPDDPTIALAIKLLELLDRGSFVATYKYAVLLGLLELCVEKVAKSGAAPESVTTRELAEKVVELYWDHTREYSDTHSVLRQNNGRQAAILKDISLFRDRDASDPTASLWTSRQHAPRRFEALLDEVEWTLIHMPLPKLQRVGTSETRFLYEIDWDDSIADRKSEVVECQQHGTGPFDNRIHFKKEVPEGLIRLSGLLRPLIQRQWASMVASLNQLEESRLEAFLFGEERVALRAVRSDLSAMQSSACFYCREPLGGSVEVDHFVPWVRHPENAIENLVASHKTCNSRKRDHLAADRHLESWIRRNEASCDDLAEIASRARWESVPSRAMSIARAIYLRIPAGTPLWLKSDEFVPAEPFAIRACFEPPDTN